MGSYLQALVSFDSLYGAVSVLIYSTFFEECTFLSGCVSFIQLNGALSPSQRSPASLGLKVFARGHAAELTGLSF